MQVAMELSPSKGALQYCLVSQQNHMHHDFLSLVHGHAYSASAKTDTMAEVQACFCPGVC